MKNVRLFTLTSIVALGLVAAPLLVRAAAPQAGIPGATPGQPMVFQQTIPVHIVLIGYGKGAIDAKALKSQLPEGYAPVVRYPRFYGVPGRDLGLSFQFQYDVIRANDAFTTKFFKQLANIGKQGPRTVYQQYYNDQASNVLDVPDSVLYIDAPSVEAWLMSKAQSLLHIDTEHGYTVFFIDWYGRPDFRFHVYTKSDEADPDTGYNFGVVRDSRKMMAWGGSHGRGWFHDISAGPEAWTNNWNVDDPDLNANGYEDYRMPPSWEYVPGGYRDPAARTGDLAKLTRYVAINLLFTSSPLYDPLVTAPGANGSKIVHVTLSEDDPGSYGKSWIRKDLITDRLSSFEFYYPWKVKIQDWNPIDAGAENAFRIWAEIRSASDCWNAYGTPYAELYCYFDLNRKKFIPWYDAPSNYAGGVFAFNTTDANLGPYSGLLGFADDNWLNGVQTYVFQFDTDYYRSIGYGFSSTTVHEFGHHLGLSHPHDGYDAELDYDYGANDDTYFAWAGDESHTTMAYLQLATGFGQFDRDNMYRYEFAGYLNWANSLYYDVLASPNVGAVAGSLASFGAYATKAVHGFNAWNYEDAVLNARLAYQSIATAATQLGIPDTSFRVQPPIDRSKRVPHEGDPIRFPDD
ncbi:MAG: hypothetical protein U0610_18210 [bacterium]